MDYKTAVREFEDAQRHMYFNHADFWKAQLAWSIFTDNLCKTGVITQRQYDTWLPPFPQGKPLKPKAYMMEGVICL